MKEDLRCFLPINADRVPGADRPHACSSTESHAASCCDSNTLVFTGTEVIFTHVSLNRTGNLPAVDELFYGIKSS